MHHETWTYRATKRRIKRPMKSLSFLEFRFENGEHISFRAQDIITLELSHPVVKFPPECFVADAARITLSSKANRKDNYRSHFAYDCVFERFLEYSDIKKVKLIYEKKYWKGGSCRKWILVDFPYLSKKPYGWEESWLQEARIDENGCLHIEIHAEDIWLKTHPNYQRQGDDENHVYEPS